MVHRKIKRNGEAMSRIVRHRAFTSNAWDVLLPHFYQYGSLTSSEISEIIQIEFMVPFHPRKCAKVLSNDGRFKVRRPKGASCLLYSLR